MTYTTINNCNLEAAVMDIIRETARDEFWRGTTTAVEVNEVNEPLTAAIAALTKWAVGMATYGGLSVAEVETEVGNMVSYLWGGLVSDLEPLTDSDSLFDTVPNTARLLSAWETAACDLTRAIKGC